MNDEVSKLAQKLHEQGIARTRMDAMKMAESMLTVKVDTRPKSRISNITYPVELERKIIKEEEKIEAEPNVLPIDIDAKITPAMSLSEAVEAEQEVRKEVPIIAAEPSEDPEAVEEELGEPEIAKKEEAIDAQVTEDQVKAEISSFEQGLKEFQNAEDVPETSQMIPVDKSKPKGELTEEQKSMTDITKLFKF